MSKAILIMDMPENCLRCPVCDENNQGKFLCGKERRILDSLFNKPDWCPLKELPEKHKELRMEEYEFGKLGLAFTHGFNDCLKEILGE